MNSKDNGLIWFTHNLQVAQQAHDDWTVLTDKTYGEIIRKFGVVQRQLGPEAVKDLVKDGLLTSGLTPTMLSHLNLNRVVMNSSEDPRVPGRTYKEAFEIARKDFKGDVPKYYDRLLYEDVKRFTNPSTPSEAKVRILANLIDPKNNGFIGSLLPDQRDAQGNRVLGKFAVNARFTSEDFAASVKSLEGQYPGIYQEYMDWESHTFRRELFKPEIDELKKMPMGDEGALNYRVKYSTINHNFGVDIRNPDGTWTLDAHLQRPTTTLTTRTAGKTPLPPYVMGVVNRLNSGVNSLAIVAKQAGMDPDSYIFSNIMGTGEDFTKLQGFPKHLLTSIQSALDKSKAEQNALDAEKNKWKVK